MDSPVTHRNCGIAFSPIRSIELHPRRGVTSIAKGPFQQQPELERGPDGVPNERAALDNARRVAFSYTKFARDCELLFREFLGAPETLTLAAAMGPEARPLGRPTLPDL
jgi:hypothetical protein